MTRAIAVVSGQSEVGFWVHVKQCVMDTRCLFLSLAILWRLLARSRVQARMRAHSHAPTHVIATVSYVYSHLDSPSGRHTKWKEVSDSREARGGFGDGVWMLRCRASGGVVLLFLRMPVTSPAFRSTANVGTGDPFCIDGDLLRNKEKRHCFYY